MGKPEVRTTTSLMSLAAVNRIVKDMDITHIPYADGGDGFDTFSFSVLLQAMGIGEIETNDMFHAITIGAPGGYNFLGGDFSQEELIGMLSNFFAGIGLRLKDTLRQCQREQLVMQAHSLNQLLQSATAMTSEDLQIQKS